MGQGRGGWGRVWNEGVWVEPETWVQGWIWKVPGASCTEDASAVLWAGVDIWKRGALTKFTSPGPSGSLRQAPEGLRTVPRVEVGSEGALQ